VTGVLVLNDDGPRHRARPVGDPGDQGDWGTCTPHHEPRWFDGDGIALAMWRAWPSASRVRQFHPTMLFDGDAGGRQPADHEAVRGEGAFSLTGKGIP